MPAVDVSEETFKKLLELKNHWSLNFRKVTNREALQRMDAARRAIYGYDSSTPVEKVEELFRRRTKEENERDMERFSAEMNRLASSGLDLEPGYTMDEHLAKMLQLVSESEDISAPLF